MELNNTDAPEEYEVIVHDDLEADVSNMHYYISNVLGNPASADRLYNKISKQIDSLELFPLRHPLVRDERLAAQGYRMLPVENYIVFYIVDDENRKVTVTRVLSARMNYSEHL